MTRKSAAITANIHDDRMTCKEERVQRQKDSKSSRRRKESSQVYKRQQDYTFLISTQSISPFISLQLFPCRIANSYSSIKRNQVRVAAFQHRECVRLIKIHHLESLSQELAINITMSLIPASLPPTTLRIDNSHAQNALKIRNRGHKSKVNIAAQPMSIYPRKDIHVLDRVVFLRNLA